MSGKCRRAPTRQRRAAREQHVRAAAMPTLRELGQAWAQAHARDTSLRYRNEVLAAVARGCGDPPGRRSAHPAPVRPPALMQRRIDELTPDEVAAAVQAARARGDGEGRHLVRALRRLFVFAVALGHVEANPIDVWLRRERGGRRTIPWMRDGIRERVLTDAELVRLWDAAASLDPAARGFTRLMMLTACRSGEISGLAWREIERDVGTDGRASPSALLLPQTRTKNGRAHRVPLGVLAALEVRSLGNESDASGARLVFPRIPTRTAAICRVLRQRVGATDWTWHDLRRTAATGMARLGCPREHVEAALNQRARWPHRHLPAAYIRHRGRDRAAALAIARGSAD
jgi:integrase